MKSRWINIWFCALLVPILTFTNVCIAADADNKPIKVSRTELDQYWVPSQEDMSPTMPPLVRSAFGLIQQHGRIVLDYEVTINEKGVPVDFKFKSITPANVDPKPFIASVMFYRYKPALQNSERKPVRLHDQKPHFMPKK